MVYCCCRTSAGVQKLARRLFIESATASLVFKLLEAHNVVNLLEADDVKENMWIAWLYNTIRMTLLWPYGVKWGELGKVGPLEASWCWLW